MRWSRTAALAGTALALSALTPLSAASATPLPLDVVTAVNSPGSPPDDGRIDVSWTVADATGVFGFAVEVSTDGETWAAPTAGTCAASLDAVATSCTASSLVVGTPYQVRVSALDEGSGVLGVPVAAAAPVTPANAPGAPGSLLVSAGDQELSLTWAAPTLDGGSSLTDYVIEYRIADPVGDWSVFDDGSGTTATGTITGLVNGTAYDVRVSAANGIGAGPAVVSDAPSTPDATTPPPTDPPVGVAPAVTAITPAFGPTSTPTTFTVTGTDLGGSNGSATVTVGGNDATDVVVSEGGSSLTATIAGGNAGAQDVVVTTDQGTTTVTEGFYFASFFSLDNSAIRFGNGYENSVNYIGTLNQPWYYSPVDHNYYKLTFGNRQLEYAIGSGTTGSNWSGANVMLNPSVSDLVVDYSRFVSTSVVSTGLHGYGTVTTTGTVNLNGQTVRVRNSYTLGSESLFLRVSTEVVNESEAAVDNLNIWVGTGDDYVGWVDTPTKQKGTLTDGVFTPITDQSAPAPALLITSAAEGALFYSTTPGANSSIDRCCSFSNAYNVQPTSSPMSLWGDGSYAVNVPAGTVAPGGSASLTWFYAAGSLAQLNDVAAQVSAASAPSAVAGDARVALTWEAPTSDTPITNYAFRWSADDGQTWTDVPLRDPSTATTETVTGLTNGTSYKFQVAAITGTLPETTQHGWSPSSPTVTPGTPLAPVLTAATAGDAEVTLEFTEATTQDAQAPVTYYQYQVGSGAWVTPDPAATSSPIVATGLSNGVSVGFRVRAMNADGPGVPSNSITAMPVGAPPAPSGVDAEQDGEGTISVWWNMPSNGGSAILDYLVDVSTDNGETWTAVDDGISANDWTTVSGLTAGTPYRFRVRGVNALGTGPARAMTYDVTLVELPGPPADLQVVPGDWEADTSWAQSETGGSAYEWVVEVSEDGGESWWEYDWTEDMGMYLELDNNTSYLVRVAGYNDAGQGEWAVSEAFVPGIVPDIPSDLVATPGDAAADLEWIAPEDTGTSDITTYVVELSTDGGETWTVATATVDGTTAHVTGLTNGTEYIFRVSAVNATGTGDPSDPSLGVTPRAAYTPPANPSANYPSALALRVGTAMTVRPTVTLPERATGFVVTSSTLPVGVVLDSRTGTLRGTPLAQGRWTVRIGVKGPLGTVVSTDTVVFTVTGGYLVLFSPGSYALSPTAKAALRVAARALLACPSCTVEIRGYAAYVNGGVSAAKWIARQRAMAARDYLRRLGVGSAVTLSVGVGYAPEGSSAQRKAVVTLHRPAA